jgi:hypothetical protein
MIDPVVIGLLSALAGFLGGHLHYKIGNSTCLYGLCSVSNVELEIDKDNDDVREPHTTTKPSLLNDYIQERDNSK